MATKLKMAKKERIQVKGKEKGEKWFLCGTHRAKQFSSVILFQFSLEAFFSSLHLPVHHLDLWHFSLWKRFLKKKHWKQERKILESGLSIDLFAEWVLHIFFGYFYRCLLFYVHFLSPFFFSSFSSLPDDSDIVDIEDDSASESKMPLSLNPSMAAKFRMEGTSPLSDLGSFSDSERLFPAGKPRIWSIVDTATSHAAAAAAAQQAHHAHIHAAHLQHQQAQHQAQQQSSANSGNSSSSSLSPSGTKSPGSSIGPISPSNPHRQALRDYASPYSKPNPASLLPNGLPPHSVASGAMPPHLAAGWPYSAAAAAAAAAAFGAAGSPGFPPLYGCPPALMNQLMGAGGHGPGGPAFPPHLMESSLNRLRNAAVAAAAAATNGNPAK